MALASAQATDPEARMQDQLAIRQTGPWPLGFPPAAIMAAIVFFTEQPSTAETTLQSSAGDVECIGCEKTCLERVAAGHQGNAMPCGRRFARAEYMVR
ncbi:MAG TPA: hypothetical protein VHG88_12085 [Burkholderiales bacterium]|nr:hypothetical protein [Burkholderiales bacterium]